MRPTIAIITATKGRSSLRFALRSAFLGASDEWIVVTDGYIPEVEALVDELSTGFPYFRCIRGERTNCFGLAQRDQGIAEATADYILFLDDDDLYMPGAIEKIRGKLQGVPVIFKMWHNGGIIWREQVVYSGNVGGQMFCLPNLPHRVSRWALEKCYGADVMFINRTLKLWPPGPVWSDAVIVDHNRGLDYV